MVQQFVLDGQPVKTQQPLPLRFRDNGPSFSIMVGNVEVAELYHSGDFNIYEGSYRSVMKNRDGVNDTAEIGLNDVSIKVKSQ